MRRPLALIGLTSMLVLTVCFYADSVWLYWLFGLAFIGLLVTLCIKKLRKKPEFPAFFAVVLISVIGFNMFSQFYVKPIQKEFGGKNAEVTAVLIEEPETCYNRFLYTLKTKTINNSEESLKLTLYTNSELRCQIGDTFKFTAELETADYGKNLADKIYLRAYVFDDSIEVAKADKRPFYYYIVKLRQDVRTALYSEFDLDTANLASAVLLGDKITDDETVEAFRRSGLTHIVVVSGLHLSIITMLYSKSIGKAIKNKYLNALCTSLLVVAFLFLTGFGKSSIRAAIMLFVLILSTLLKRESDSLNSLGLAAILLCFNPYIAGDVGVLLSFSATFGIVVFSKPLYNFLTKGLRPVNESYHKRINKSIRFIADLFATTITAIMCTLPVNVLFFGKVSLVQIFANLLVIPMVKWFMLSAAIGVVGHYVPVPFVKEAFAFAGNIIGKAILYVAKFFASLPMAYVKADYRFVILWIIAVIVIFSVAYFIRRNGKGLHIICLVMSVLVFMAGSLGHIIYSQNTLSIYVTPSKYGQSIVLSSKDGNLLLYSSKDDYAAVYTEEILEDIYTNKELAVISVETDEDYPPALFDYNEVLMYDKISKNDCEIMLWNKALLKVFERNGAFYSFIKFADTSVLVLPDFGNAADVPEELRKADVLITSGIIDNMELLSFKTLISNGNDFRAKAVIDYFRNRDVNSVLVSRTINFDIVG